MAWQSASSFIPEGERQFSPQLWMKAVLISQDRLELPDPGEGAPCYPH